MTTTDDDPQPPKADPAPHPEQEHPEQEAHGGSMAPGLVDDTGHPVEDGPPGTSE